MAIKILLYKKSICIHFRFWFINNHITYSISSVWLHHLWNLDYLSPPYFYYSNNNRSRTVFVVSENLELRHAPCPRTLSPPTYVGPSHVCENDFSHEAKRKRREEEGEKESTRHVVLEVGFVVVCSELHRTDSRWTPNTGTSPTDIILNNKLWSDGDKNTQEITTAELWTLASKQGKPFRRSLARNTRSGLHGVSCYSCFDDRNSFRSLFSRRSSSLEMFPQKMGFYKHEIGPSNSEW